MSDYKKMTKAQLVKELESRDEKPDLVNMVRDYFVAVDKIRFYSDEREAKQREAALRFRVF